MKSTVSLIFAIFGSAILVLLFGCGDGGDEVRVYKISHPEGHDPHAGHDHADPAAPGVAAPMAPTPSGGPPSVNPSSSMTVLPGMESTAAAIETPEWSVPSGWEELPPTSIRKGNFRILQDGGTVEITVTAFPGDVGGLEANVNRWRQQIGLSPIALADMGETVREITVDAHVAYEVDLANPGNPEGLGIRGAVIPHEGQTWFVKMVGNQSILTNQESNLTAFLDSIRF